MELVGTISPVNARSLFGTIATALGTVVTDEKPILEGELPIDGSRFEGLLPPVVSHPSFTIRKKATHIFSFSDYVAQKIMSESQKNYLVNAIKNKSNILIVGGTGSNKTTLANAVIDKHDILRPM